MNYLECEEDESLTGNEVEHLMDHLQGLVEDIYETGSIEDLEFHLEEVLGVFGMEIPKETPVLQKKRTVKEESTDWMLKHWVGYTRAYADMMMKN